MPLTGVARYNGERRKKNGRKATGRTPDTVSFADFGPAFGVEAASPMAMGRVLYSDLDTQCLFAGFGLVCCEEVRSPMLSAVLYSLIWARSALAGTARHWSEAASPDAVGRVLYSDLDTQCLSPALARHLGKPRPDAVGAVVIGKPGHTVSFTSFGTGVVRRCAPRLLSAHLRRGSPA